RVDTNTARRDGGETLFRPRLRRKSPGPRRRQEGVWPLGVWTRPAVPRAVGIGDFEIRPVPPGVSTRPGRLRPFRVGAMERGTKPLVRSDRGGFARSWGQDAN